MTALIFTIGFLLGVLFILLITGLMLNSKRREQAELLALKTPAFPYKRRVTDSGAAAILRAGEQHFQRGAR